MSKSLSLFRQIFMSCAWRHLKYQTPDTLFRLKRFAKIYFEGKNPNGEIDLYWWFECIWKANLTQHDRFILWQFDNAKQVRLLLTIKDESASSDH